MRAGSNTTRRTIQYNLQSRTEMLLVDGALRLANA
jgi:hypothetical protein